MIAYTKRYNYGNTEHIKVLIHVHVHNRSDQSTE